MKKIITVLFVFLLVASQAFAFLYTIKILTKEELKELKKEDLAEVYLEAKIEEKASGEFHIGAGFSSSKDYGKRKDLLRFIVNLRREMAVRDIEPEPIEEWLK